MAEMERSRLPQSGIAGVQTIPLTPHPDRRGWLTEIFRDSWLPGGPHNLQVNVMWSRANSLRGVHVHGRHADWFVVLSGRSVIGLKDVRRASPTCGAVEVHALDPQAPMALLVPPGVVHGLYFPVDSLLATVETFHYDPDEEHRCRWDDPALGIAWPVSPQNAILSDKDRRHGRLRACLSGFNLQHLGLA